MGNNLKLILQEDDCAPDAIEYFGHEFERITGLTVDEFKKKSFRAPLQDAFIYSHKGYRLMFSADDPCYKLYEN